MHRIILGKKAIKDNPNISQWSFENGYTEDGPRKKEYPFRVFHARETGGLLLALEVSKPDLEYVCGTGGLNFHISLTVPGEKFASQTIEAPFFENTHIVSALRLSFDLVLFDFI